MTGRTGAAAPRRAGRPEVREPAGVEPVARVVVDVPLAHLDRVFDYLVPAGLDGSVVAGSRVRVRFAGQLVDAIVLSRVAGSEHEGRLAFVERATSAEPVLSPAVAVLARAVADRWAGSMIDVLRLALPPRHARVEAEASPAPADAAGDGAPAGPRAAPAGGPGSRTAADAGPAGSPAGAVAGVGGWGAYRAGAGFVGAIAEGRAARAVWSALPGEDWAARYAEAAAAALSA
ncbi:MAG TPA: hypothetical protein VGP36_12230, partial [Mycobacteriales bacterium]|nr:hypothetical protein [Mycobacteriales bacterium]